MNCVSCTQDRRLVGRGLCDPCYRTNRERGTLADYPKLGRQLPVRTRPPSIMVEEYQHLSQFGLSVEEVAARLGVLPASLKTALGRHAKAQARQ